jgi:hypothetical protein
MIKPAFLGSGVVAHLRLAAGHGVRAVVHLGYAGRVIIRHILAAVVAAVVLFEEWGWRPLADLLGRLARLAPIAVLEARLRTLPPYGALAVFALPSVLILPLKLVALYLIAQGHTVVAASLFVGAKIVGTALVARIYMLTEHALMQIGWFKRAYDTLMPLKHALVDWARESAAWKYGRVIKLRVKRAVAPLVVSVRTQVAQLIARFRGLA